MATQPASGEVEALIDRGWGLADGDLTAQTHLLIAEAFNSASADPATDDLVERALALARRIDDPLAESAALDQLTSLQLARGRSGPRRGARPGGSNFWRPGRSRR